MADSRSICCWAHNFSTAFKAGVVRWTTSALPGGSHPVSNCTWRPWIRSNQVKGQNKGSLFVNHCIHSHNQFPYELIRSMHLAYRRVLLKTIPLVWSVWAFECAIYGSSRRLEKRVRKRSTWSYFYPSCLWIYDCGLIMRDTLSNAFVESRITTFTLSPSCLQRLVKQYLQMLTKTLLYMVEQSWWKPVWPRRFILPKLMKRRLVEESTNTSIENYVLSCATTNL